MARLLHRPSEQQDEGTSDNQLGTRQLTHALLAEHQPTGWDRRPLDVETLSAALTAARAPRGKRRRILSPKRPRRDAYQSDRGRSTSGAWHRCLRHLCRVGLRALNDVALAGALVPPDETTLAEALDIYLDRHVAHLFWFPAPGDAARTRFEKWSSIDLDARERLVDYAARAILDTWGPDWIADRRERGRRGGQTSRRGATWTFDDLDRLACLDGLTIAQQAEELDVSRSTIDRMRRALRDRV